MKICHLVPPARRAARDQGGPILAAMSANVDLKELRQNASEVVRRAQAGEEITIAVSGRPRARLPLAQPASWTCRSPRCPMVRTRSPRLTSARD